MLQGMLALVLAAADAGVGTGTCVRTGSGVAAPAPVAITSTKQSHRADVTVAAGGPGWLVVWEEIAPRNPDAKRKISAALIDDGGKVVFGPKILMDGGGFPNDMVAVWNGTSFTIVVCNGSWDGKSAAMVWGELATDGKFTRRGRKTFEAPPEGFFCRAPVVTDGRVNVQVTVREESYNDDDEMTSRECATRRVSLVGSQAKTGKPAKLCWVTDATAAWVAGTDVKDRLAFADASGKLVVKKAISANGVGAVAEKFAAVSPGRRGDVVLLWFTPPFRDAATKVGFERGPLGAVQNPAVIATPGDRLTLLAATPDGGQLAIYSGDGKLVWQGRFGPKHVGYNDCAPGATSLLCAFTDDSGADDGGEVNFIRFPLP